MKNGAHLARSLGAALVALALAAGACNANQSASPTVDAGADGSRGPVPHSAAGVDGGADASDVAPGADAAADTSTACQAALDPTFGDGGVLSLPSLQASTTSFLLQPDGKALVGIARYLPDWTPDVAFNQNVAALGLSNPASVALQPDGKIVAFGGGSVVRIDADGTLDTTFGDAGAAQTPSAPGLSDERLLAIGSGGNIVVSGLATTSNVSVSSFVEWDSTGSLSAGFGQGGLALGPSGWLSSALIVQSDGSMIVAGTQENDAGTSRSPALMRLTPGGAVDTTFGAGGLAWSPSQLQTWPFASLAFDDAGNVVVNATDYDPLNSEQTGLCALRFQIVRYRSDGSLDPTFGEGGLAANDGPPLNVAALSSPLPFLGLLANGGYVVAGATGGQNYAYATTVMAFNHDGKLDPTVGAQGFTPPLPPSAAFSAAALESNGPLILAGFAGPNGTQLARVSCP